MIDPWRGDVMLLLAHMREAIPMRFADRYPVRNRVFVR